MSSGKFNFLETYGPLQACNGIALPFYVYMYMCVFVSYCSHKCLPVSMSRNIYFYATQVNIVKIVRGKNKYNIHCAF